MRHVHHSRPIYGRLAWLDELRLIAILLMVLDHSLLFFVPDGTWPSVIRLTVTRCAEPMFVFVLAYLTIYLKRSMKFSRWCQIAAVSVVTSSLLSRFLGVAVADVLVSIAVTAPLLPVLLRIPGPGSLALLHLTAIAAVAPVLVFGIAFDYSPFLILHQMILARLHSEEGISCAVRHGAISLCLVVLASVCVFEVTELSSSIIVMLFGHPVAALIIWKIQSKAGHHTTRLAQLAKRPLTVYCGHLLVFSVLTTLGGMG